MTMQANEAIEITPAANGFIVRPTISHGREARHLSDSDVYVFQSFMELSQWLSTHFSYRNPEVKEDGERCRP